MHFFSIYLMEEGSTPRNLFVFNFHSVRPLSITGDQQQDAPCQFLTVLCIQPSRAHHFWLILLGLSTLGSRMETANGRGENCILCVLTD